MANLTGIGFSNFRVFKNKTFFDLAPISIFTGTNSSGKSSIFKGLLLLKENAMDPRRLIFSGESHKLGTFTKALNSDLEKEKFGIRLKVNQEKGINLLGAFTFAAVYVNDGTLKEDAVLSKGFIITDDNATNPDGIVLYTGETEGFCFLSLDLKFLISKVRETQMPQVLKFYDYLNQCDLEYESPVFPQGVDFDLTDFRDYDFSIVDLDKVASIMESYPHTTISEVGAVITEKILESLSFVLFKKSEKDKSYRNVLPAVNNYYDFFISYANALKDDYFFEVNLLEKKLTQLLEDDSLSDYYTSFGETKVNDVLSEKFMSFCKKIIAPRIVDIANQLRENLENIGYIEAIRANSQRLYTNQSQGTGFNKLLLDLGQSWDMLQHVTENGFSIKGFIDKWLQKFNIGSSVEINRVKGIATEVVILKDGKKVDLIDLGYGVTQFLPILLYIAFNLDLSLKPKGLLASFTGNSNSNTPLLLIEEPESNLHPKLQSLLADFFIDVAENFRVTLLIETHSEYLIRRLQVLTASEIVKPEDSVIYYLDGNIPSDSDKFVKKININSDGSLTNDFGPGFIDEATNWKMELMRLKNAQLQNLN